MDPEGEKTNKNKTKSKENKKPQTCKHNIANEERNMIFSCHNTISAQLKKKTFQPRSLSRKMLEDEKTQRYCLSHSLLSFFFFFLYCMKRKLSFQISYFGRQRVCQSLDKSGKGSDILNTKRRHWPHSDIWTAATGRSSRLWNSKSPW